MKAISLLVAFTLLGTLDYLFGCGEPLFGAEDTYLDHMNYHEEQAFMNLLEEIIYTVNPFSFVEQLYRNKAIQKLYYEHLISLHRRGIDVDELCRKLMKFLPCNTNFHMILRTLTQCGYLNLAAKLYSNVIKTKEALYRVEQSATKTSSSVCKFSRQLKRNFHNTPFHDRSAFFKKLVGASLSTLHKETNYEKRSGKADTCITIICAAIDAKSITFDNCLSTNNLFTSLETLIGESRNPAMNRIAYYTRLANAKALAGNFDQSHQMLTAARCEACNVEPDFEFTNLIYTEVLVRLWEFEANPTKELRDAILFWGKVGLKRIENEDMYATTVWKRNFIIRMSLCLLGLSNRTNKIKGCAVDNQCLQEAGVLLKEFERYTSGIETRRKMFYNLLKGRFCELTDNIDDCLKYLELACDEGKHGGFEEAAFIAEHLCKIRKRHKHLSISREKQVENKLSTDKLFENEELCFFSLKRRVTNILRLSPSNSFAMKTVQTTSNCKQHSSRGKLSLTSGLESSSLCDYWLEKRDIKRRPEFFLSRFNFKVPKKTPIYSVNTKHWVPRKAMGYISYIASPSLYLNLTKQDIQNNYVEHQTQVIYNNDAEMQISCDTTYFHSPDISTNYVGVDSYNSPSFHLNATVENISNNYVVLDSRNSPSFHYNATVENISNNYVVLDSRNSPSFHDNATVANISNNYVVLDSRNSPSFHDNATVENISNNYVVLDSRNSPSFHYNATVENISNNYVVLDSRNSPSFHDNATVANISNNYVVLDSYNSPSFHHNATVQEISNNPVVLDSCNSPSFHQDASVEEISNNYVVLESCNSPSFHHNAKVENISNNYVVLVSYNTPSFHDNATVENISNNYVVLDSYNSPSFHQNASVQEISNNYVVLDSYNTPSFHDNATVENISNNYVVLDSYNTPSFHQNASVQEISNNYVVLDSYNSPSFHHNATVQEISNTPVVLDSCNSPSFHQDASVEEISNNYVVLDSYNSPSFHHNASVEEISNNYVNIETYNSSSFHSNFSR